MSNMCSTSIPTSPSPPSSPELRSGECVGVEKVCGGEGGEIGDEEVHEIIGH